MILSVVRILTRRKKRRGKKGYQKTTKADFTEAQSEATADGQPGARRSLLLAGEAGDTLNGTAEFLRLNGYHVVTAHSADNAFAALSSGENSFGAAMLLAEAGDAALLTIVPEVRRQHPKVKLILKLTGRDSDEMPSGLLNSVDLFIPPDLPQSRILEKLSKSF